MNDFSEYFEHSLTEMQSDLLSALSEFVKDESSKVFVLNGFAGTGKTWIVAGFMRWLIDEEIDYVMLASTGRAAKVLSDKCGADATTVHKHIYTFDDLDDDLAKLSELQQNYAVDDKGQLKLLFSLKPFDNETTTVYIIDESSMI
jgi:ATP-dependent exoDNAse (exonuclease V) alpha subunit